MLNSVSSYNSNLSFGSAYFAKIAHGEFNKAQKAIVKTIAEKLSSDTYYKYEHMIPAYVKTFDAIGQQEDAIYFVARPVMQKGKKGVNICTLYGIKDVYDRNNISWYKTGLETFIPDNCKNIISRFGSLLKKTQKNLGKITDVSPCTPTLKITNPPVVLERSV